MGKLISIQSQKYFNEFKNGKLFDQNLGDYTNNFTGSVMENEKVSVIMNVSWDYIATASNSVSSSPLGYLTKQSGDWKTDGFSVGDTFDMTWEDNSGSQSTNGTVSSLSENIMYVTGTMPDSGLNGFVNASVSVLGTTPLTSLVHSFGLIENDANINFNNIITGTSQAYYGSGLSIGGGFVDFNALGQVNDWVTGSFRCQKLANPSTYVQQFEIEHEILIPFDKDGEDITILPSYLDGLNSLKYAFSSSYRAVLSDQNTGKDFEYADQYGNVGGYGENFNGFDNDFSVVSVGYEEQATGNTADGVLIGSKTTVTVEVERVSGSFTASDRFGVYMGYRASQQDYTGTILTNFKDNFIYDRALNNEGVAVTTGDVFITDCSSTLSGGNMIITFDVEYTNAQKLFLSQKFAENPVQYVLGVLVGDENLVSGNSDRVMLLADSIDYDESADIPDLIQNAVFNYYPYTEEVGVDAGFTGLIQWNENGITVVGSFDLDLDKEAFINSFEMMLVAYNNVTQSYFELDTFTFNLNDVVVSAGVQQINTTGTRNYNLEDGSQFNEVSLTTGVKTANLQTYNLRFSQKISWQDWIPNNEADTIFYDNSEPNNNLNNKASNYSNLNNYNIGVAIFSNLSGVNDLGVSGLTNYFVVNNHIEVHNYNEDGNFTPIWSWTLDTFNPVNMTNLGGGLMPTPQDTLFRVTWTNINGAVTDISDLSAIHRIEETGQNGYNIDELGTLYSYPNGNRVIPKDGFTNLDMYIDSGNAVTECLVDGSAIESSTQYNLSAWIVDSDVINPDAKQMSPSGFTKSTSGFTGTKVKSP